MTDRETGLALLASAAVEILGLPGVTVGRMFGSEGYSVRGKMFAFVATDGRLVAKLPAERIDALGLPNMVMHGRSPMREWGTVPISAGEERWRSVTEEAFAYVDAITP